RLAFRPVCAYFYERLSVRLDSMKALGVAAVALFGAVSVLAQDAALEPEEWTVPWEKTRPRDPIMDQSGRVWFVGQAGNYVAYLDAKSGQFKRYPIAAGTFPPN